MARIPYNTIRQQAIELSYIDLCNLLAEDIKSDDMMPDEIQCKTLEIIRNLAEMVMPYSA